MCSFDDIVHCAVVNDIGKRTNEQKPYRNKQRLLI